MLDASDTTGRTIEDMDEQNDTPSKNDTNDTNHRTIALVTGANKGIGSAIAEGLGARGLRVLVGARDDEGRAAAVDRLRAQGIDAHGVQIDVTDHEGVVAAAADVEQRFGRLDVLVNNAGISGRSTPPPGRRTRRRSTSTSSGRSWTSTSTGSSA